MELSLYLIIHRQHQSKFSVAVAVVEGSGTAGVKELKL